MFPIWDEEQTSKNAIYVELRRSIIMRHIRPGERFDVEALAKQYKTSVTPVRDALQMLSQDGLVNIKPRSGYFVARTTLKQLRDLLDLRHIMELAAIERAVVKITPEQIAELRSIHTGYTGDDDLSYDRYTDENRRFHYGLAKASGNYELMQLMGRLHDRLAPSWSCDMAAAHRLPPTTASSMPWSSTTSKPRARPCWMISKYHTNRSLIKCCRKKPKPGMSAD